MRLGRISAPTDLPSRAGSLQAALAARGIAVQAPPDFGREPLLAVHSADYLDYLEHAYARWQGRARRGSRPGSAAEPVALPERPRRGGRPAALPSPSIVAQTGYYLSDLSCPIGPHTWRSALRSTHSAVAAADHVAAHGGAAYALCRPSGHHAHRDRAGGFCYLNSSAAAAARLRRTHARVAVLDVDAHHGDGTQQIFYRRADVMTASLHADPPATTRSTAAMPMNAAMAKAKDST